MAQRSVASLESVAKCTVGVRVEFYKQGDRFSHTIFVVDGNRSKPLLGSSEGANNESAPPSPPLAELHQQDELLFLTGATTLAHWSMSVEAVENRLVFDVACRSKSEASRLGSEYRVLDKMFPDALKIELQCAARQELANGLLRIGPGSRQAATFPATAQWQYTIASKA